MLSEEEKKAIDYCKYTVSLADRLDEVIINLRKEPVIKLLNLIEKQQKENIVLRQGLEENTEEIEKKDKIINELLTEITAVNSGRYEYMDNSRVLEIFTNKVEE